MTQHEYGRWLYEQTAEAGQIDWAHLTAADQNQWVRLGALVQADRKALASQLTTGLEGVFEGIGRHAVEGGMGRGFGKIKDVIRELDPKGPIT